MSTNEPAKSIVHLKVEFHATGDTPRLSAASIAKLVRDFLSVEMELAGADVAVTGAFLNYKAAYEAEQEAAKEREYTSPDVLSGEAWDALREQRDLSFGPDILSGEAYPNEGFAEGVSRTLRGNLSN